MVSIRESIGKPVLFFPSQLRDAQTLPQSSTCRRPHRSTGGPFKAAPDAPRVTKAKMPRKGQDYPSLCKAHGLFIIAGVCIMSNFYGTVRWAKKRISILQRDKYQCQDCKRYGRLTEATEVHHIKPFDEYPELAFDSSNLVSLCHACHNTRHPEKAKAARMSVR